MALADNLLHLDGMHTWYNGPPGSYDPVTEKWVFSTLTVRSRISTHCWDFDRRLLTYGAPRSTDLTSTDDHNSPATIWLNSGKVLVAYQTHNGTQWCARTTNAGDVNLWDSEVTVSSGNNDAYSQLWQAGNDAIYWIYRRNLLARRFRVSTDDGDNWSDLGELIAVSGERPYTQICPNGAWRLDFFVSTGQPSEVTNSLYHFYMEVDESDGSRAYYQSDGTLIGDDTDLPLTPSTDMTLVWDGATRNSWNWSIEVLTEGQNPVLGFTTFTTDSATDDTHHYHQARWSGSAWVTDEICEGGDTSTEPHWLYTGQSHYSGGIACDPNDANAVYVSRKYGAADWRIEKWTHSGTFGSGTWSKDSDLTGASGNGKINARPYCVRGRSPTQIYWWSATAYTLFTSWSGSQLITTPEPDWRTPGKPSSVSFQAGDAPAGLLAYYLLNEGSGNPADLTGNGYGGTVVGSPTWNSPAGDDFGAFLSGFSTANYIDIDALAAAISSDSFHVGVACLFKNTSTAGTGWLVGIGNSGDSDPLFGLQVGASSTAYSWTFRDAASVNGVASGSNSVVSSGNYAVLIGVREATQKHSVWVDAFANYNVVQAPTTTTFDRGALGALRRASMAQPFAGELHAVFFYQNKVGDPYGITQDLMRGQFAGTFAATGGGGGVSVPMAIFRRPMRFFTQLRYTDKNETMQEER